MKTYLTPNVLKKRDTELDCLRQVKRVDIYLSAIFHFKLIIDFVIYSKILTYLLFSQSSFLIHFFYLMTTNFTCEKKCIVKNS